MPAAPPPAFALLACAALLAGFAAAVRALSRVDHRPRPDLLAGAAGAGVLATLLGVSPVLLGPSLVTFDLSTLAVLAVAGVVAGADLLELGIGARLVYLARPAASALVEAETARKGSHPVEAAAAYKRAIAPLQAGEQPVAEIDARLAYADSLVSAGEINEAARALHDTLERARAMRDPELNWSALLRGAILDADLDRPAMARRHLAEAATVAQESLGRPHLASVFAELGWVGYLFGDPQLGGVCLAWASAAAGRIDPDGHFAADTTLLAAFLALAQGDLVSAESACAMVNPIGDPDLAAALEAARVCLSYLQGWHDSARKVLDAAMPKLVLARWRSRLVLPLLALALEARRRERPEDARAIGEAAQALAVKGGTMSALARHCSDPGRVLDPLETGPVAVLLKSPPT